MNPKSKFCTIYLIRHGQTEWNIEERMQGHQNSSLTKEGKIQAQKTHELLKKIHFSAIYSSDLGRAKETAKIIALNRKMAVTTTKLIRERYFGRLEGRFWHELKTELKDLLEKRESLSYQDRSKFRFFPETESDEDIVSRLITFLREVAVAHLKQNILVVSHGGIMRAFLIHLGFANYQELPAESIQNTGYITLQSDGTDFFIKDTYGIRITK